MLKTKGVSFSRRSLSSEWCYRYLLGIPPLDGSNIKIKSPFSIDRTPSFSLFKKEGSSDYRWRCFSTGRGEMGSDHIELFIQLQEQKGNTFDRSSAFNFLFGEYETFIKSGEYVAIERKAPVNGNAKVTDFEMRQFNKDDLKFWNRFQIRQDILENYNTAPLKRFVMKKIKAGKEEEYVFENPLTFGYFTNQGDLFEIYQPTNKASKCIKVQPYIKGWDQCKGNDTILITEAVKDCMAFQVLEIDNVDIIGADSANVVLKKTFIEELRAKYKFIGSLFDDDDAGHRAAAVYQEKFQIPMVPFKMGKKDLSDTLAIYSAGIVKIKMLNSLPQSK